MSATSYLPRGWPPKYCHHYESLRPCSGWERVFSSRLVTDKLVIRASHTQNCIMIINFVIILFCFAILSSCGVYSRKLLRRYIMFRVLPVLLIASLLRHFTSASLSRKSPRPISNARLKMLPLLHLHPINVVICHGTY